MLLHENKELFDRLVTLVENETNFQKDIIIKDYYAMFLLEKITESIPSIIFKGGTSLSKAHKIISRFSEDIDLTCSVKPTLSNRREISHIIQTIIHKSGFLNLKNEEDIRSKSDHNKYDVEYPYENKGGYLKNYVQIETAYFIDSFPCEEKEICSYIFEYLLRIRREDIINEYGLHSFKVKVQTIERTFIDKVFALCDYTLRNSIEKRARHIYDLYKLYPLIKVDNNFKELINDVRILRRTHGKCESAKEGIDINDILKRIKTEDIYKDDFENTTKIMLANNENVTYEEALSVIDKIIDSKLFV